MTTDLSLALAVLTWTLCAAGWAAGKRSAYGWDLAWAWIAIVLFLLCIAAGIASIYVGWLA